MRTIPHDPIHTGTDTRELYFFGGWWMHAGVESPLPKVCNDSRHTKNGTFSAKFGLRRGFVVVVVVGNGVCTSVSECAWLSAPLKQEIEQQFTPSTSTKPHTHHAYHEFEATRIQLHSPGKKLQWQKLYFLFFSSEDCWWYGSVSIGVYCDDDETVLTAIACLLFLLRLLVVVVVFFFF